jgi:riboflavin synthase
MFTGLIQQVGSLADVRPRGGGRSLVIRHAAWDTPLAVGESVAVQGVCLTVTACRPAEFTCDTLAETLARTTLGGLGRGARLNLERALRADERLGGHVVTGHVDGVGRVLKRQPVGPDWLLEIGCDAELLAGIVLKGSIAVDGISLTVAALTAAAFAVHIIPHTWTHTALADLTPGAGVNLETDILGKYVQRALATAAGGGGLSPERLRRAGFGG